MLQTPSSNNLIFHNTHHQYLYEHISISEGSYIRYVYCSCLMFIQALHCFGDVRDKLQLGSYKYMGIEGLNQQ